MWEGYRREDAPWVAESDVTETAIWYDTLLCLDKNACYMYNIVYSMNKLIA